MKEKGMAVSAFYDGDRLESVTIELASDLGSNHEKTIGAFVLSYDVDDVLVGLRMTRWGEVPAASYSERLLIEAALGLWKYFKGAQDE